MRISDWSSDVCSSDLAGDGVGTVDRRSAAGQDLDPLDRGRGDRVEVHRVGLAVVGQRIIGCAATVDQDQLVTRAQSTQVEEAGVGRETVLGKLVLDRTGELRKRVQRVVDGAERSEEHTSELQVTNEP